MNEEEKNVLRLLSQAASEFGKLEKLHRADLPEFVHAIHAAQNIVLSRAGMRAMRNADVPLDKPLVIE